MNLTELHKEAHATELGTPSYACKVRECSKVQTWSADEMFWWPGDWRHEKGWYCWDCSHGILEDVQLIRLDQVLDPDVTTKPWPDSLVKTRFEEVPAV